MRGFIIANIVVRDQGIEIRACLKNMDQLCYFNKMATEAI